MTLRCLIYSIDAFCIVFTVEYFDSGHLKPERKEEL